MNPTPATSEGFEIKWMEITQLISFMIEDVAEKLVGEYFVGKNGLLEVSRLML